MKYLAATAIFALCAAVLSAQQAAPMRFEVASIRPTDIQDSNARNPSFAAYQQGKATSFCMVCITGRRYEAWGEQLKVLIADAFHVDARLISGPKWLDDPNTTQYLISALMPENATREQVPEMLRALLEERFHLALHRGTTDQTGYALVAAKSGARLKPPRELVPGSSGCQPWVESRMALVSGIVTQTCQMSEEDGDGTINTRMTLNSGVGPLVSQSWRSGTFEARDEFYSITMSQLANRLGPMLSTGSPLNAMPGSIVNVIDRTGIDGPWDVVLNRTFGEFSLPTVSASLEKLGLHLERTTVPAETLIVDHIDRTPTEN